MTNDRHRETAICAARSEEDSMERETTMPRDRETLLYPSLYFKDQLARLESIADETGDSVARLVREAIDTFLGEKRTAGT